LPSEKDKKKKEKEENSQSKRERKQEHKRKKIPDQGSEENRRNIQKGLWTRQYLNNTGLSPSKQEKKGNHDLKWSSPFYRQPKSCASMACSPLTKKNRKGKDQEHSKPNFPKRTQFPRKVLLIHDRACNL